MEIWRPHTAPALPHSLAAILTYLLSVHPRYCHGLRVDVNADALCSCYLRHMLLRKHNLHTTHHHHLNSPQPRLDCNNGTTFPATRSVPACGFRLCCCCWSCILLSAASQLRINNHVAARAIVDGCMPHSATPCLAAASLHYFSAAISVGVYCFRYAWRL